MKYIAKKEFGNFFGLIAWTIWKPKIVRNYIIGPGKKVWSVVRAVKNRLK